MCTTSTPSNYIIASSIPVPLSTALSLGTPASLGELYESLPTDNKSIYEFDSVCNCYMDQKEFYERTLKECANTIDNSLIIIHSNNRDNSKFLLFGKKDEKIGLIYRLANDLMKRTTVYLAAKAYYEDKSYSLIRINKCNKEITKFQITSLTTLYELIKQASMQIKQQSCIRYTLSTSSLEKKHFLLVNSYIEEIPLQLIRYATHRQAENKSHLAQFLATITVSNNYMIHYLVGVSPMGQAFEEDNQLLERIHKLRKDLNSIFSQHQKELANLGLEDEVYNPYILKPYGNKKPTECDKVKSDFTDIEKEIQDVEDILSKLVQDG